jgi:hypothetical protein
MPPWMACHAKEPDRDAAQRVLSRIVVLTPCRWVPPSEGQSVHCDHPFSRTSSRVSPGMRRRRPDLPDRRPHSPSTRRCSGCALAVSGHVAVLPITLMKSRRRMPSPKARTQHCIGSDQRSGRGADRLCRGMRPMSALAQKLPRPS